MAEIKDIEENMKSTYSLITERGILGGLYFGFLLFCIFLSIPKFNSNKEIFPWVLLINAVVGIIISNISYELFLPLFRLISGPLVKIKANKIRTTGKFNDYKELRAFREEFLNDDANTHLKGRIKSDEKIRQTLTYIASTNMVIFGFSIICFSVYRTDESFKFLIDVIIGFVFISTFAGILLRAWSLGSYIGLAYNKSHA